MNDRRPHVPIGFSVADSIASITRSTVVLSAIESEWDALVRLAASIKSGTVTATVALGRLGSISTGDPLYRAAKMLRRLERSILLCDVMTNPDFRRALHRDLFHGEAVHSLQRAIYQGALRVGRGRRAEEMAAISGSLTLLTDIVTAWNARWLQRCLDEALKGDGVASVENITRMARFHHQHINFNGQFRLDVAELDARLFKSSGTFGG